MKKISLILLLLFSLILVACDDNGVTIEGDLANIEIVEQKLEENVYTFKLNLGTKYEKADLQQIFYDSAASIFNEIKDDVGLKKHILNISFSYNDTSYGELIFAINNSIEEPGLKLLINNLTFE